MNGCNVLLVRIPDDFSIGQRSCKSLQGETNGFQLSPSRALNTFRLRSMLVKYQFTVRLDKCTTRWIGKVWKSDFDWKRSRLPINPTVEGVDIIRPEMEWNELFREEDFTIPGESRIHWWKEISGHNAGDWPHASGKRTNLACSAGNTFNVNWMRRILRRQNHDIERQLDNTFSGSCNRAVKCVENDS